MDGYAPRQPVLRQRLPRFRYVVPEGTYLGEARLQQAWENLDTGQVEWMPIETVVVSREEFFVTHPPARR